MRKSKYFLFLVVLFQWPSVEAEQWSKSYDIHSYITETESRVSSRQAALEGVRKQASAEAGTYVQSTVSLQGDELSESVQVLSASMVKLDVVEESMELISNDTIMLNMVVEASVDETLLHERIRILQADDGKVKQLTALQQENTKLRERLSAIDPGNAQTLSPQGLLLSNLRSNEKKALSVFEPGLLLEMAGGGANTIEAITANLEEEFYKPIMEADIRADVVNVIQDGEDYLVKVQVGWAFDINAVATVLNRWLVIEPPKTKISSPYLAVIERKNQAGGPTGYSDVAYSYIKRHGISLEIALGPHSASIPVTYSAKAVTPGACEVHRDPSSGFKNAHYCVTLHQYSDPDFHGINKKVDRKTLNPIVIRVGKASISKIDRIQARMVRVRTRQTLANRAR